MTSGIPEAVFVAVLGLLTIYLALGIAGALTEVRRGTRPRTEVLGFLAAVLILLLLGVLAYSVHFAGEG